MLHTFFERVTHALKFTTMLRREVRRGMHTIYDNLQRFEQEVQPALAHAKAEGDVEAIERQEQTAEDLLLDHGERLDVDIEIDVQVMQLRIQDKLDGLTKFLTELNQAITRAQQRNALPPTAANKLRSEVASAVRDLDAMYAVMIDACANEYRALLEEHKSARDGRTAEQHWMEVRARGFARLSRAMHEVFQLPKEQRGLKREVDAIEKVDRAIVDALEHLHANAQGVAREFEQVDRKMQQLVKDVHALVEHVRDVFSHLTEIMRVFVMYFFLVQHAKGEMDSFFLALREWQFPEQILTRMQMSYKRKEAEIAKATDTTVAMAQRSRRGPQAARQRLKEA